MSDDDSRRGPKDRGPGSRGGGSRGGGSRGGGFGGGSRGGDGPRKPFGKPAFGGGPRGRDDKATDRPARSRFREDAPRDAGFKPRRSEGGEGSFKPRRSEGGEGSFKPRRSEGGEGSFKPRRSEGGAGGFRDAPAAGGRPYREGGDRPRRFEGERPFKPRPGRDGAPAREERGGFRSRDDRPRTERPAEFRSRDFKPRDFTPRSDRPGGDRPRDDRPRDDRPRNDRFRDDRFRDDRPREFPPREDRGPRRFSDNPRPERTERLDGPRTSSRPERRPFLPRGGNPERLASPEKAGGVERIAKVIARAGAASRREAEEMIEQGRVTVDGVAITSPALDVAPTARITIDGEPLPARERTRLWLYHKPSGLVSTNFDPEGRTTLFERLPEDLPRVITVGRLDINTEGLLLLTNDGGLARVLGHPETAWLRRYRVRAYGQITQDKLDAVRGGVTIDGENFGPVIATRDRETGDNTWLTVDLREGKNREVKRVLEHLGLVVNRLIRISFGPFQLADLPEGEAEEVRTRVLRDQLGEQLATIAGVDFDAPVRSENRVERAPEPERSRPAPRGERNSAPRGERPERPRDERGPRRSPGDKPGRFERPGRSDAEAPSRRPREGAYHRAREEAGNAPRDILLRAEEGRGAIWRDEDTTGMKPQRTGPRRGADPREERAQRDASGSRERVRAKPIEDPKGRRVTVERVTGASPDLPRKPRYTRADFAAPSGDERPFRRPRQEDDRPPRREAGDRPQRKSFDERPPRGDGERRGGFGASPSGSGRPPARGGKPGGFGKPSGFSKGGGRSGAARSPDRGGGKPGSDGRPSGGPRKPR